MTSVRDDRPLFTIKPGLKQVISTTVISLIALGLFVFAVGLYTENSAKWPAALALVGIGLLFVLWAVYEARGFLFIEQYFADRVERLRGGTVKERIDFSDRFQFSYAVRADGSDRLLTIRAADKVNFTVLTTRKPGQPATSAEPSVSQVEGFRDHLAQVVAAQIEQLLDVSHAFQVDRRWTITAAGIEIDGQKVPWSELDVELDGTTGNIRLNRLGTAVAQRSMTSDNVLGALRCLRARVPVR